MKPFDIEAAKRGEPILYASMNRETFQPVHFVGQAEDGTPVIQWGKQIFTESESELRMAPKKRTIFLNIYQIRLNDRKAFEACAFDERADAIHDSAVNGAKFHTIATPVEIEV